MLSNWMIRTRCITSTCGGNQRWMIRSYSASSMRSSSATTSKEGDSVLVNHGGGTGPSGKRVWKATEHDVTTAKAAAAVADGDRKEDDSSTIQQQQQPQHSKRIMTQVARRGVAVCGVLYMCVGYFAVAEFSKQVQSNILQNYCSLGPQLGVAFVCMTAAIVMAFPLNIFPARITLDGILTRLYPSTQSSTMTPTDNDDDESSLSSLEEPLLREIGSQEDSPESTIDSRRNDERRKYCRHVTLTVGIAGLALVMAILVPDISIVFGLLGGTSSSLLNFIMPGLFCLKTRSRNSSSTGVGSLSKQEIRAWCLVVGGTLVGVTSTAVTLYSLFIPSNDATTDADASYCSTHHNTSITDESA
uniref:Amino acid transporter transmembrane domain-containing protein n=1 Tax=Attheya septentrionalis TaxID=420275 RepID=A0A7S2XQN1_9STRA|mmetsp:Transcript_21254/g.38398  ORF Transcript_21254/g.38398 Transcript_21254/m.38398 type:complete len:359 (+) Transcript_21254:211-1287(+)